MKVFFYGLFMDEALLAGKGIRPEVTLQGFIDGYALRIGERATLVPDSGGRVYGVAMEITENEVASLYAEASVVDYSPEPVTVELSDGNSIAATCYNLPAEQVTGTNRGYALKLLDVASRLKFPESYLGEIRSIAFDA